MNNLKAWSDAEPVLREGLVIREKLEPDVWNTFNAQSLLGEALAGQKKFAEAEPLLLQGQEGIEKRADKIPGIYRLERRSEAVKRLVQLYQWWGKPEKVAEWRKKLDVVKDAR